MKIERGGMAYFIPQTQTEMVDGVWTGMPHKDLLPTKLKELQDKEAALLIEDLPSDEELLDWAKQEHPVCQQHVQATELREELESAWQEYKALMVSQGVQMGDMPEYGGMAD
jgi:spore cortex formation protein SpoVR/YcgB (stage V sporulation)